MMIFYNATPFTNDKLAWLLLLICLWFMIWTGAIGARTGSRDGNLKAHVRFDYDKACARSLLGRWWYQPAWTEEVGRRTGGVWQLSPFSLATGMTFVLDQWSQGDWNENLTLTCHSENDVFIGNLDSGNPSMHESMVNVLTIDGTAVGWVHDIQTFF